MSNRTTLAQLAEMEPSGVHALPLDHIAMMLEDVALSKSQYRIAETRLNDELLRRFGDAADATRKGLGKDTGTVTILESGFRIRADLPKRVVWDQAKLAEVSTIVQEWGEPLTDFMTVEYKVAENKFNAWPRTIKAVFEPARTVAPGAPTFKIEREAA